MALIENAAKAAAEDYGLTWADLPYANPVANGEWSKRDFYDMARAVLTAIREPSEAMVEAGFRGREFGMTMGEGATATWQAMVDAALQETA